LEQRHDASALIPGGHLSKVHLEHISFQIPASLDDLPFVQTAFLKRDFGIYFSKFPIDCLHTTFLLLDQNFGEIPTILISLTDIRQRYLRWRL
jgi:hypothetical protein